MAYLLASFEDSFTDENEFSFAAYPPLFILSSCLFFLHDLFINLKPTQMAFSCDYPQQLKKTVSTICAKLKCET